MLIDCAVQIISVRLSRKYRRPLEMLRVPCREIFIPRRNDESSIQLFPRRFRQSRRAGFARDEPDDNTDESSCRYDRVINTTIDPEVHAGVSSRDDDSIDCGRG